MKLKTSEVFVSLSERLRQRGFQIGRQLLSKPRAIVSIWKKSQNMLFHINALAQHCVSRSIRKSVFSLHEQAMPKFLKECIDTRITEALIWIILKDKEKEVTDKMAHRTRAVNVVSEPRASGLWKACCDDCSEEYARTMDLISRRGLLKVLLTTYLRLLPNSVGKDNVERTRIESLRIFRFVASLAASKRWNPCDVLFEGEITHFVIVPVAARYGVGSIDFYAKRIEEYGQRKDIDAIFVLAIGAGNSFVAEKAALHFFNRNQSLFSMNSKNGYNVRCLGGRKRRATTVFLRRQSHAVSSACGDRTAIRKENA